MAYRLDYRTIDNNRWSGSGPVFEFMRFNRVEAEGICIDIFVDNTTKGVVRQRGYEIVDKTNNVCELIIGSTEFSEKRIEESNIIDLLEIINIAYGLVVLGLSPEQIIYPGGLYGVGSEVRAIRGYMRPKNDYEIACRSEFTKKLSDLAKKKTMLSGVYCLDRGKISHLNAHIDLIIKSEEESVSLGFACSIKDLMTPKIYHLLKGANDLENDILHSKSA